MGGGAAKRRAPAEVGKNLRKEPLRVLRSRPVMRRQKRELASRGTF